MTHVTRGRAAAATAVLLAGLSLLSACGDGGTTVTTKDGSVKVDDDKVTVKTDEGTATLGQGLPDGFPTDVPLVDEDVVSGVKGSDTGQFAWSVVMQSSRSVEDLTDEVQKDYSTWDTDEGSAGSFGDVSILHFTNATYDVGVTIARTGDKVAITYVVKDAG